MEAKAILDQVAALMGMLAPGTAYAVLIDGGDSTHLGTNIPNDEVAPWLLQIAAMAPAESYVRTVPRPS